VPLDVHMPPELRKRRTTVGYAAICAVGYPAEPGVFCDLIKAEAISLRARTWTHQELIDRLQKQLDEEADRFAAGHI
jgi:hypothetical protein